MQRRPRQTRGEGYEVHIFRGTEWSDGDGGITFDEWESLIARSVDFRLDGFAEATSAKGETLRYDNPGLAAWTGHPTAESERSTYEAVG